jgi:hypothetical protein
MMSPAQSWTPPGPGFVTARHRLTTWAAHCWMPAGQERRCRYPVQPPVIRYPVNQAGSPGRESGFPP